MSGHSTQSKLVVSLSPPTTTTTTTKNVQNLFVISIIFNGNIDYSGLFSISIFMTQLSNRKRHARFFYLILF